MKWIVIMKPLALARNARHGGELHREAVECDDKAQAGTLAQVQARGKGIHGYAVTDIRPA